jgi:hypothetical protein
MRVGEVAQFYEKSGPAMFDKVGLIERFKNGKFRDKNLAIQLQEKIARKTGDPMAHSVTSAYERFSWLSLPREGVERLGVNFLT